MVSLSFASQKSISELSDREILALAIQAEEEDGRIYREFADGLRKTYPASAHVFDEIAKEESEHRRWLLDLFQARFGDHVPLIRRDDVRGFIKRKPAWMMQSFDIATVRHHAEMMEVEAARFYRNAAGRSTDPAVRKLLGDLADVESDHQALAHRLEQDVSDDAKAREGETARRMFVLQIVQPGLAGLMDGSVSTLAPLFCGRLCDA
jgi:erythrin-vacuolar iron transport family protein